MTEQPPQPADDDTPAESSAPAETTAKAVTKAEKLEAKAAKLREAELAKAAAGSQQRSGSAVPWMIACAVVVLALIASMIYAVHEHSRGTDARHALAKETNLDALRASAIKTATTVATSFGTYDYKTLSADFARTRAYLTPSFAADFSKITSSLGSLITQDKGQIVGTVDAVGVQSITESTAVMVVFLDQKVTTAQSSTPRLDHNRLLLTLTLQPDKRWLVSKLVLV